MIDDRKQSETTLEHAEASLDTSEDRVKENNATKTNAPGDKTSPESASNSTNQSESELESPDLLGDSDSRDQHLDETLDDLPSETLELKDLEFDGTNEGVGSAPAQPEIGVSGEERDATVRDTPPQVQAAQLQIMEALQLEIESLKQQLAKQTEQADSVKAQSVRIAADFDNFRKRTQKEKEDLEVFAKRNTINELLPVVDNFERARSQIRPANDGEMGIHKSYQGVYKNLVDCLKRLGVSAMRPEGQEFDPNYHEAMLREQTAEYPEGAVIEQLVRGYMIGDRVLRHAMVKVAAAPEEEINSSTEGNIDSNSGSESSSEQ